MKTLILLFSVLFTTMSFAQAPGDGSYQVDRLNLYNDDIMKIIKELEESNFKPFTMKDFDNYVISNYDPKVQGKVGLSLTNGSRTKYEITRPWGTSTFKLGRELLKEPVQTFLGLNYSTNIPYENIFGTRYPSYKALSFGKNIIPRFSEISDIQPATLDTLVGKIKLVEE